MELTNRDLAFGIWLTIVAVGVLARPGGRKAVASILAALRGKLALVILAFGAWTAVAAGIANALSVWNVGLLKDTLAWFTVPGMVLLFGFQKAYERRGYYGRTLLQVIGLTALTEFYVNLAAFDLWVELLLLPLLVVLAGVSALGGLKPDAQVAKRFADRVLGLIGLMIFVGTAVYLVNNWQAIDKAEVALQLGLPIWLTVATLPFIFVFSLVANYETTFIRINLAARDDPRARRRAKLALLVSYRLRNRELHRFTGQGPQELARARSWADARRIIAFHRAGARYEAAQEDLKMKRLERYAGVQCTDVDGRPLDQREFEETKRALDDLHTFHSAQHSNGRYREDLMTIVGGPLSKTFPEDQIVMTIGPSGRSWCAWRRTVSGWVFGIGASGGPPDLWTWEGPEPPERSPGPGTDWTHRGFNEEDAA